MRKNFQESEFIPDPRVEELTDELIGLVEGDPRDTERSISGIIHGNPREMAVKMMLTWAVTRSETLTRRDLGFGANSHVEPSILSSDILEENRASAARVAQKTLDTFYELIGTFGETFRQTGLQAQEHLSRAMTDGILVAEVAELFHIRLKEINKGQGVI